MDGSWWRVLTKCGPLEEGMANHFSIPALRTPWTVWKDMWLVTTVLDIMDLRTYGSEIRWLKAGSVYRKKREYVWKRGSTARVKTGQKENVGGRQTWEKGHEISQKSRLNSNRARPAGHVKNSEFYPKSSLRLCVVWGYRRVVRLALKCHSSSRRTITEGKDI